MVSLREVNSSEKILKCRALLKNNLDLEDFQKSLRLCNSSIKIRSIILLHTVLAPLTNDYEMMLKMYSFKSYGNPKLEETAERARMRREVY